MGEMNSVSLMLESIGEGKSVVSSCIAMPAFLSEPVSEVDNLLTVSMPSRSSARSFFLWMDQNFHSLVVERRWLGHVDDVKFDSLPSCSVSNLKVVPLSMALCVDVILENEVIFALWDFDRHVEVSGFKPRLESKSLIVSKWLVVGFNCWLLFFLPSPNFPEISLIVVLHDSLHIKSWHQRSNFSSRLRFLPRILLPKPRINNSSLLLLLKLLLVF